MKGRIGGLGEMKAIMNCGVVVVVVDGRGSLLIAWTGEDGQGAGSN